MCNGTLMALNSTYGKCADMCHTYFVVHFLDCSDTLCIGVKKLMFSGDKSGSALSSLVFRVSIEQSTSDIQVSIYKTQYFAN